MRKRKKLNERLIARVIKHIREDFRRFEMSFYGVKAGTSAADGEYLNEPETKWPSCNTKACFAGWAVLLSTPKRKWNTLFTKSGNMRYPFVRNQAAKLLGLNNDEAENLFTCGMTGSPRKDLKDVERVLNNIRKERKAE